VPSTVQPIVVSADVERLRRFYAELLGAVETRRVPEDGPLFFLGLRLGSSDLGLVQDDDVDGAPAGRILLSIDVPDVAALVPRIAPLGGLVTGGPNDMPWGQRVVHAKDPDGNAVNLTQEIGPRPTARLPSL
jgi:predicted enzyme related to lactoylglutathione lyase